MLRRLSLVCSLLAVAACAQQGKHAATGSSPSVATAPNAAPVDTPARLFDGMGNHHRTITTSSAQAQRFFDQGFTWMYAFNHDEAIRSFKEVARLDPNCAMAWWGVAVCNGPHINRPGMTPRQNAAAWDAIQRAQALSAGASATERAMIEALAKRYAADPPKDRRTLDESYAAAMRDLWRAHPNDADIGTLCAESLMDLHPWDLWTIDGSPKPGAEDIVSVLEAVLRLDPSHPGANHLYIHAVEASAEPGRASAAADRLRHMVPASGHLLHMPSHIDVRTGKWAEAAACNERAIKADEKYRSLSPRQDFYRVYMAHDNHFLSYVCMMQGRSARSLRAARDMIDQVPKDYLRENAALMDPYMFIDVESLMRFGRWDDLLRLREPPSYLPITRAYWRFTRGIALAAKGDIAEAQREQQRFRALFKILPEDALMAINNAHLVMDIADHVLSGEIAYREKKYDEAIGQLQAAAELESRLLYMEPPEWIIPVRHTLGAVLLEAGRPGEAEAAYRYDLRHWPENGWSLYGLSVALRSEEKTPRRRRSRSDSRRPGPPPTQKSRPVACA